MQLKVLTVLGLACVGVVAHAQYSTGFESPPFTVGSSVVGVDGWTQGSGSYAGLVTSDVSASGSNSFMFDMNNNAGFNSVRHNLDMSGLVRVSTQLYITGNNSADRLASVLISNGTMGGTRLGLSLGGDGVIRAGSNWTATYSASGIIGAAGAGTYADRWLTVILDYDPVALTGNVSISGFGDGAVYSQSYTGLNSIAGTNVNLGVDYLGSVSSAAGVVYFDNFSVDAVPEPATMIGLGGLALAALARKRRK